ncbi:rifin PIR protein, putative [Plasmodium reichenowi]|uniref:Rifin PIR protein, putative n=1 Tax=Plasmodium reichenowi TaxID=5854 RepID=A0A2P9DSR7_PLARE|nr:rifin PIR protein, putative [Plasmodium reichenowi]
MKVHYINILLFALPINILVHNQRNHKSTTHHTPATTSRVLSECDTQLSIDDKDADMKSVIQQFEDRTSQRFHEYDERMIEKRKQCKNKCDKEIQKIILKDKLEKQMAQKLTTLETKIDTDDIPTCVCEKSMADKMEKTCLKCTQNFGGIIAPSSGVLAGIAEAELSVWQTAAIKAVAKYAAAKGAAAGIKAGEVAGKVEVIERLRAFYVDILFPKIFKTFQTTRRYTDLTKFSDPIIKQYTDTCTLLDGKVSNHCNRFKYLLREYVPNGDTYGADPSMAIPDMVKEVLAEAEGVAADASAAKNAELTAKITEQQTNVINTLFMSNQTIIIASVIAIVVIVLIMVIIYLILRYRRKKKMKKKLQYIKLLEE